MTNQFVKIAKTRYDFMERAYELASNGIGHTRPNPPVGAVIVKKGEIIGEGFHAYCGGDHAEVAALKSCKKSPKGATVYCTLEPCSKPGRVGACCDALIAAGVKRVEWACADPNPHNGDCAAEILNEAGIQTFCWEDEGDDRMIDLCADIVDTQLKFFDKHVKTGLPYVHVKLAMSLDGKICDNSGKSQWISGKESRRVTAQWRQCADVIMVGAETIRKDNPSLLCHTQENKDLWRAVISKSGNLPKDSQVFTDEAKDRTLVYSDPVEAVKDLGKRGFMFVLCEGGLEIARTLATKKLVDEWTTIMCPMVIGDNSLDDAIEFGCCDTKEVDCDEFITAYRDNDFEDESDGE